MGTVIVSAVLLAVIFIAVRTLIKDKKKGKSSCGSGCASCAMNGKCHSAK